MMCEQKPEGQPLAGETLVFTGSSEPADAMALAASYGADVQYLPLIRTVFTAGDVPDMSRYGWLIFTSATAVKAFLAAGAEPNGKVAAVGEKTAEALEKAGISVQFVPSIYAADVFVQEFPAVAGGERCLFVKGALAKGTITGMPLPVDEWTVYDTVPVPENGAKLAAMEGVTVIFASPSAVHVFTQAGGDWSRIRAAAIGHVTEEAIEKAGGCVSSVPRTYTYMEVIHELTKGS